MATVEQKLEMVKDFDEMSNSQKDYVASIVATDKNKRVRDVADDEVLKWHKDLIKQLFDVKCQESIEGGFISNINGHIYRTNRDDQINLIGEYLLLREDYTIATVYWKTEDAGVQPVSREDFMMIYREALVHKNLVIQEYWKKKVAVDNCTTHAQLRNITWDFPTPDNTNDMPVEAPIEPSPTPEEPTNSGNGDTTTEAPTTTEPTTEPTTDTTAPTEEPITTEPIAEEPVQPPADEPTPVTASIASTPTLAEVRSAVNKRWKPSYFSRN